MSLRVFVSAGLAATGLATATPAMASAGESVAFQADAAHSGRVLDRSLGPPLQRRWTRTFPYTPSYPVVAAGRVFVTSLATLLRDVSERCRVTALSARTGRTLWTRELGSLSDCGLHAYDAGRLFVTHSDQDTGGLETLSAADGRVLWRFPGRLRGPPVAAAGVVYLTEFHLGGAAAMRASDGALLWRTPLTAPDVSVALGPDRLAVGTPSCNDVDFLRRSDGAFLVDSPNTCTGGGWIPAYHRGRFYMNTGNYSFRAYDAISGTPQRRFATTSQPAFAGLLGVFSEARLPRRYGLYGHTLTARSLATGRARWHFRGDGYLDGPPLIVNDTAYVGSGSGAIFGVSLATGRAVWRAQVGAPVPRNQLGQLTGLGAGDGTLVVPALRRLVGYR